ncbi:MAG: hypothetical protein ACREIS_06005 [Nitrospiraceae bacterium]
MGLNRQMALAWIERQRLEQDRLWGAPGADFTRRENGYGNAAPHLLVLEEKVARLRSIWYEMPRSDEKKRRLFEEFSKVCAIAFRALEEMDGPEPPDIQP